MKCFKIYKELLRTLYGIGSIGSCNCGNLQWDQTKVGFFALDLLAHSQTRLSALWSVCLLYCPRIRNLAHHVCYSLMKAAKCCQLVNKSHRLINYQLSLVYQYFNFQRWYIVDSNFICKLFETARLDRIFLDNWVYARVRYPIVWVGYPIPNQVSILNKTKEVVRVGSGFRFRVTSPIDYWAFKNFFDKIHKTWSDPNYADRMSGTRSKQPDTYKT